MAKRKGPAAVALGRKGGQPGASEGLNSAQSLHGGAVASATGEPAMTAAKLRRLEMVAYHEAGHAVIAWRNHIRFKHVTIVPVEGESLGHVRNCGYPSWFRPDIELSDRIHMRVEHEILLDLAGQIAQAKFLGRRPRWGMESDDHSAVDMAYRLFDSPDTVDAYLKFCYERAKDLVNGQWPYIERLAQALLEKRTLDYEDALEVIMPGRRELGASIKASMAGVTAKEAKEWARKAARRATKERKKRP